MYLRMFRRHYIKITLGNAPESGTDFKFSVNFCHVLSRFYLCKRINDPVSVT